MATQIVMDHNGDTRHTFDANDPKALRKPRSASRNSRVPVYSGSPYRVRRAGCETRV
jgi:hypothetical protein